MHRVKDIFDPWDQLSIGTNIVLKGEEPPIVYVLALVTKGDDNAGQVCFVDIYYGEVLTEPVSVKNFLCLTEEEAKKVLGELYEKAMVVDITYDVIPKE